MGKDNPVRDVIIIDIFAALCLWWLLVCFKAAGAVDMHWALVLSSLVSISWVLHILTVPPVWLFVCIRRRLRRKKNDRRIIRQAKATGAWDKNPTPLGGRALELKAWEDFKLKRRPGESDVSLRCRCMNAADNEYAERRW